jgi:hypothetical protein
VTATAFAFDGFRCEVAAGLGVADPAAEARRLFDPASALETVHWGRNYLYRARLETVRGPLDVVVKQFRGSSMRDRWRHRLGRESKAARSWRVAHALAAAGIATAEPVLLVESAAAGGPSLYVCRHLARRVELRYLLRARNAGSEREAFPELDAAAVLEATARLARRLHDSGFWHRDFSVGNLLIEPGPTPTEPGEIALIDLNRCHVRARVTLGERMRDLARLPLERPEDRARLLAAYFGAEAGVPARARLVYEIARRAFHGRHRFKGRMRAAWTRLRSWLVPRGAHAHIPPPPAGAAARDKIVWDALSDQPHSHAGRWERLLVRAADLPDHVRSWGAVLSAAPRIRRRYRELVAARHLEPFAWPGAGIALRPHPADPGELLAAFDALGLGQALIRLHPWQGRHDEEEALARELAGRGVELAFALPQSRELVREPARWRASVEEIAARFLPYGRRFQIGQAINRSKWGVWSYGEYLELAAEAAAILRRRGEVELAGPAVIDFEAHATVAVLNRHRAGLRFDALAALLYVDRRGAPESRQLGYDTADKATLMAAIAETSPLIGRRRQWITEFNWPLREGPHSPAGRSVAVDEATQADYLVRYYLAALGTGYVERAYWWQLVARGYGLIDPGSAGGLRRRPAFAALATLERELAGAVCLGRLASGAPLAGYRFRRRDGGETHVAWSLTGVASLPLPAPPTALVGRDGEAIAAPRGGVAPVGSSPLYVKWAAAPGAATERESA